MNRLLLSLTVSSIVGWVASASGAIVSLNFDTAGSSDSWNVAGDPFNETSKTWLSAGGNPGGAISFGGTHNGSGAGRGYMLSYTHTGDFTGATELTFDGILLAPNVGTNVQLQILLDGVGSGFVSLSSPPAPLSPLNESSWTSYSFDVSTVTPGATTLTLNFLLAAGAFAGAGTTLGLDNVSVIPEPSTYAAIFGLAALGVIYARRRRAA